jgi:hypothetical protein
MLQAPGGVREAGRKECVHDGQDEDRGGDRVEGVSLNRAGLHMLTSTTACARWPQVFQMHVPKPVEPTELAAIVAGLAGRDAS